MIGGLPVAVDDVAFGVLLDVGSVKVKVKPAGALWVTVKSSTEVDRDELTVDDVGSGLSPVVVDDGLSVSEVD